MKHARIWLTGAALALLIAASPVLLDGPDEFDADRRTAAAARDVERAGLAAARSAAEVSP